MAPLSEVVLGGGCFWCLQPVFEELRGVEKVVVGYAGGSVMDPTYEQVCTGRTGHAEVVEVTFDSAVLPLEDLLQVFFSVHDPTTLNRQGHDVGTQYRSVIFAGTSDQKATAEQVVRELDAAKLWGGPIVTQISPGSPFYAAEDYHQDYFAKNPDAGYCRAVVAPKVAKFRKQFRDQLKT
jgi:peptide-methionine (S)-S-oxide reductase